MVEEAPPEEWLAAKAAARAYEEALANTPDAKAPENLIKYDKGLTLNNDKRKPQHSRTLMGFSILLGTFIFSVADAVSNRRKMKMEEMQLKEMELEMEAEKNAVVPADGGGTAFGSLEHGGDERGQEMFNAFKWQQDTASAGHVRNASMSSHLPLGNPHGAISELDVTVGSGAGGTVHGTIDAKKHSIDSGLPGFEALGLRNHGGAQTQQKIRNDPFAGRESWPGETFEATHRTQNSGIRVPTRGIIQDNEPRIKGLSHGQASAHDESIDHGPLGSIRPHHESMEADPQDQRADTDFQQAFKYIPQHAAKPAGELPAIGQKSHDLAGEN